VLLQDDVVVAAAAEVAAFVVADSRHPKI